jgi:hypothetical protein
MKTELRIGNIISYENTAHVVEELHSDKVIHSWNGERYVSSYDSIEGFPITAMLRFNFNLDAFWQTKLCVRLGDNGFYIVYGQEEIFIQHVHRFQNFYFAYTGEELKFKP